MIDIVSLDAIEEVKKIIIETIIPHQYEFKEAGTYEITIPSVIKQIRVTACGGGAGGAAETSNYDIPQGGGGGGGGAAIYNQIFDISNLSDRMISITVGKGGNGREEYVWGGAKSYASAGEATVISNIVTLQGGQITYGAYGGNAGGTGGGEGGNGYYYNYKLIPSNGQNGITGIGGIIPKAFTGLQINSIVTNSCGGGGGGSLGKGGNAGGWTHFSNNSNKRYIAPTNGIKGGGGGGVGVSTANRYYSSNSIITAGSGGDGYCLIEIIYPWEEKEI